jgi:hypothetical protein
LQQNKQHLSLPTIVKESSQTGGISLKPKNCHRVVTELVISDAVTVQSAPNNEKHSYYINPAGFALCIEDGDLVPSCWSESSGDCLVLYDGQNMQNAEEIYNHDSENKKIFE